MKLIDILRNLDYELIKGSLDIDVSDIIYDSRKKIDNSIFIALVGYNVDGHKYIKDAIANGSKCIIISNEVDIEEDVTVIKVSNTRHALAITSSNYFDRPNEKLITIGVTGTKGKTTTTFMIKRIMEENKDNIGLIGTNGVYYNNTVEKIDHTTPESYDVYRYMRKMVDAGMKYVVMEVSSQALKFNRVDGIVFDYGVITNLTHDHISDFEHPTLDDYIYSKSLLFQRCKHGVFNIDDDNYNNMIRDCKCDIYTYGCDKDSNIVIENVNLIQEDNIIGINVKLGNDIDDSISVNTPGIFSAYNATCAIAVTHLLGASIDSVKKALVDFKVKGRVESVPVGPNVMFIIDYAHNGVSMESILNTMRKYNPKRLITIFGCGGNRSKDRRYEMGKVSGTLADLSIITSDNPRFENPQDIINDILSSINKTGGKYVTIIDRKDAIRYAIENSLEGDIILLLGKGHEDYQEIEGVKYHFDDRETVEEILRENA